MNVCWHARLQTNPNTGAFHSAARAHTYLDIFDEVLHIIAKVVDSRPGLVAHPCPVNDDLIPCAVVLAECARLVQPPQRQLVEHWGCIGRVCFITVLDVRCVNSIYGLAS